MNAIDLGDKNDNKMNFILDRWFKYEYGFKSKLFLMI